MDKEATAFTRRKQGSFEQGFKDELEKLSFLGYLGGAATLGAGAMAGKKLRDSGGILGMGKNLGSGSVRALNTATHPGVLSHLGQMSARAMPWLEAAKGLPGASKSMEEAMAGASAIANRAPQGAAVSSAVRGNPLKSAVSAIRGKIGL